MTIDSVPGVPLLPTTPAAGDTDDTEQAFRQAMRAFASPVAIVTARDADGWPRGLTCSAISSVSMSPPSMLICVNQRNGSLHAIRYIGGYIVNLLGEGSQALSEVFASPSAQKFAGVRWRPTGRLGLPLLEHDAIAYVECALQNEIHVGTHAILIGLVRSAARLGQPRGPLVYHDRTYGHWATGNADDTCTDSGPATRAVDVP
jgi:flavin reductase (DIM6/NTAB) family NADH-FMN oxidoreductase RutF